MNNRRIKCKGKCAIYVLVTMLACGGAVSTLQAGEYDYGLGYSGTYSSNIEHVPAPERTELINSLLAGFAYQENTPDVIAYLLSQVEHRDYRNNVFGDETLFNLNSSAVWTISPQRFIWTVEDDYLQAQVDATSAYTPDNRTNVNVFNTGPDIYIRLAPVHTLALGARYWDIYTGRAESDSNRSSGFVRWLYEMTVRTSLSLNYEVLDVRHDDNVANDDFAEQDVFFQLRTRPSRSEFTLDLGATDIRRNRGGDTDSTLARLSWTRQLTSESLLGVSFRREMSETGTDVATTSASAREATPGPLGLTPLIATSDVYLSKASELFYRRRGTRFGMAFQASGTDMDYEVAALDRRENEARLDLDYYHTVISTVSIYTQYAKTKYLDFVRRDTDRESGVRWVYFISRNVSIGAEGLRSERASTAPSEEFVENRVLFTLFYSSGPLLNLRSGG